MSTVTMSDCGTKITVTRSAPAKSVFQYLYLQDYSDTVVKFPGNDFALSGYPGAASKVVQQGMEDTLNNIIEAAGISYVD